MQYNDGYGDRRGVEYVSNDQKDYIPSSKTHSIYSGRDKILFLDGLDDSLLDDFALTMNPSVHTDGKDGVKVSTIDVLKPYSLPKRCLQ